MARWQGQTVSTSATVLRSASLAQPLDAWSNPSPRQPSLIRSAHGAALHSALLPVVILSLDIRPWARAQTAVSAIEVVATPLIAVDPITQPRDGGRTLFARVAQGDQVSRKRRRARDLQGGQCSRGSA
jgi:hypothetical protein